jgi:acetyl/propionyl-CoA carboxylase alpha subunit/acetyl-CoA carboxylase carboxyltransferase component
MGISKILIANRGEIAIRIARAAADLGIPTAAVYSADDARSLHVLAADEAFTLQGTGPAAYLDIEQIIAQARNNHCDAIHPGYGFLSENVAFARRCEDAGIKFIGPGPDLLDLFGNKVAARQLANKCNVPLVLGTEGTTTLKEARAFFKALGPDAAVMIKSVSGGGGRGIRRVYSITDLDEAFARCRSEARTAFGHPDVYVERLVPRARHIEVQVIGDGKKVVHMGERECTLQRRNQKLVEIAPCPTLSPELREKITGAALHIAEEARYISLGTFEFLVEESPGGEARFAFMEVNPRLQVEHTVTEEVTGVDLAKAQIEIASGRSLADLGLTKNAKRPAFYAVQLRINMETIDEAGDVIPDCGTLSVYEVPSGPGIRVDGYGYSGYTNSPAFDSLLAKLVVTSRSSRFEDAIIKARRVLREFRIEGVETNIPFLSNLLLRPEVACNDVYTRFIEDNTAALIETPQDSRVHFFEEGEKGPKKPLASKLQFAPPGTVAITAPMQGCVVDIEVIEGDAVTAGQKLVVLESMKMEHVITSDRSGYVRAICVELNDNLVKGDPLIFLEEAEVAAGSGAAEQIIDLDAIRPDLAEIIERNAFTLDQNRPEAVARRHKKNQRTARENVEDLCDPGTFIEYGALIVAAQRTRRSLDDLIRRTPADGLIAGIGSVNGSIFSDEKSRCMVMAYDYTVLAGTQGMMNHKKMDRMLHIANQWRLPTVLFAEGGGGRPGDVDANTVAGLDLTTFTRFGALSGKVPVIGIVEGPCFAGNAALLGCCDVIIATTHSNIGMGGPAMIEGGGLGVVKPEEIGPIDVQTHNGVVDIAVADEQEAVAVARKYLGYFQGATSGWETVDQRRLRWLIPENRLRVYDVRSVIETLADTGSVLELRRHFGPGMVTSLIRIEGRPFGVIANDSMHQGGAIEAEDADKAARFMQLCNVHRLPILSLCDTPGFMVGPDIEVRAQVRHVCRMFVVGAHATVPFFTVVLRKGYGLGAMAMSAGGFHDSFFTTTWPTGEFGGMGLEGAVKHGFRKEIEAIEDPAEREKMYKFLVEQAYAMGKAINMASYMEIDSVIDPSETRRWIMRGLKSVPASYANETSQPFIDPW